MIQLFHFTLCRKRTLKRLIFLFEWKQISENELVMNQSISNGLFVTHLRPLLS